MIKLINSEIYWDSASGWSKMIEQKINEIIKQVNKMESLCDQGKTAKLG